jgi:hypothetical protein
MRRSQAHELTLGKGQGHRLKVKVTLTGQRKMEKHVLRGNLLILLMPHNKVAVISGVRPSAPRTPIL